MAAVSDAVARVDMEGSGDRREGWHIICLAMEGFHADVGTSANMMVASVLSSLVTPARPATRVLSSAAE